MVLISNIRLDLVCQESYYEFIILLLKIINFIIIGVEWTFTRLHTILTSCLISIVWVANIIILLMLLSLPLLICFLLHNSEYLPYHTFYFIYFIYFNTFYKRYQNQLYYKMKETEIEHAEVEIIKLIGKIISQRTPTGNFIINFNKLCFDCHLV